MQLLMKIAVPCSIFFVALAWPAQAQDAAAAGANGSGSPVQVSEVSAAPTPIGVKRYRRAYIARYAEYNPVTCEQIDSGTWTIVRNPLHGTMTLGTTTGKIGNCPGTFTFATIFYKWTIHNNTSVTDRIIARWKTADGKFDNPLDAIVRVPIVRPIGERSIFKGWHDTRANWMQRLIPPEDDKEFDFSGELVRERFLGSTESCVLIPGASLGSTPPSTPAKPWTVGAGNTWGPDQVGYNPCTVAMYRCIKKTPCGYRLTQAMEIKSPVDKGWTGYVVNTLMGAVEGSLLSIPGQANKDKTGLGFVFSLRGNGGRQQKFWVSNNRTCPASAVFPC
jgi:hypothetical protein